MNTESDFEHEAGDAAPEKHAANGKKSLNAAYGLQDADVATGEFGIIQKSIKMTFLFASVIFFV